MTRPTSIGLRLLASPILWCVFWLAVFDLASGLGLRVVAARHPGSGLARYFDYGRSIEGKLQNLTSLAQGDTRAQILSAGWLDPAQWQRLPAQPLPGTDLLVAVYGQSFAKNATSAMATLDGRLTLRQIAGPAAPLDHSYAALCLDQGLRKADVVVVGILASSVTHIGSMSGMDWTFENPAPFTFPHYTVKHGQLTAEAPNFSTEAAFRTAFAGKTPEWQRFKRQLTQHDPGYDRLVFENTLLDSSNLVKLMRRGWVAHNAGYDTGVFSESGGFRLDAKPVQTMKAILLEMAKLTRSRNERLIVLLEHDQGYGDHLYLALKDTLASARIEFISTHSLFSASDPHNFVADGHYTEEANGKLAAALRAMIRRERPDSTP